jgi:hypothetical protein
MTSPTTPPVQIAAAAVVPPHVGSGPLTVLQLQRARVRTATEMLTQVAEDLEDATPAVSQAVCTALQATLALMGSAPQQSHCSSPRRRAMPSAPSRPCCRPKAWP